MLMRSTSRAIAAGAAVLFLAACTGNSDNSNSTISTGPRELFSLSTMMKGAGFLKPS